MAEHIDEEQQEQSEILRVRREKLAILKEEGRDPYEITTFAKTHSSEDILANFEETEGKDVAIAGRIISKRVMGKASFFHIMDGMGKIQAYARRDVMGDEPYAEYKKFDIGDIVGITGEVFKTNAGEF
ncbi:MAG: OB-fold nucleic acid binding domain-containing protein, partial [Christensenella sp.]